MHGRRTGMVFAQGSQRDARSRRCLSAGGQSDRAAALRERLAARWRPWNQTLPGNTYVKHQLELAQRDISR